MKINNYAKISLMIIVAMITVLVNVDEVIAPPTDAFCIPNYKGDYGYIGNSLTECPYGDECQAFESCEVLSQYDFWCNVGDDCCDAAGYSVINRYRDADKDYSALTPGMIDYCYNTNSDLSQYAFRLTSSGVDCDDTDPTVQTAFQSWCDLDPGSPIGDGHFYATTASCSVPDGCQQTDPGYGYNLDCDDNNRLIYPGVQEHCADEINWNCQGGAHSTTYPDNCIGACSSTTTEVLDCLNYEVYGKTPTGSGPYCHDTTTKCLLSTAYCVEVSDGYRICADSGHLNICNPTGDPDNWRQEACSNSDYSYCYDPVGNTQASCVQCHQPYHCNTNLDGPICDDFECVECTLDSHCSSSTPNCYVDIADHKNNACVGCVNDADCSGTDRCQTVNSGQSNTYRECQNCVYDTDCPIGVGNPINAQTQCAMPNTAWSCCDDGYNWTSQSGCFTANTDCTVPGTIYSNGDYCCPWCSLGYDYHCRFTTDYFEPGGGLGGGDGREGGGGEAGG